VLIDEKKFGISRDALYEKLKEYNIFARRYFYPLLNEFACYQSVQVSQPLTVAEDVSRKVLTLPTYMDLAEDDVHRICDAMKWCKS
jgi:dTDP-4-amino-4,6-dideoxygalactose transaminase